jgi:hypothetical protein
MRKNSAFTNSVSSAFRFANGYIIKDTLEPGVGYWLKYATADSISFTGYPITSDTIDVKAGWNLIGTISATIPVMCVLPIGTVIISDFYGYHAGYFNVATLAPMNAYWVKVSTDGKLVLGACARR